MYAGRDFDYSSQYESELFGFDYQHLMHDAGEGLVSSEWTIALVSGTDASPSSRLVGSSVLSSSYVSVQRVADLQPGCLYTLSCLARTSDNRSLVLWAYARSELHPLFFPYPSPSPPPGQQAMATILPNGRQQFFYPNGQPLASGLVYTYEIGGSTPKTTWQDKAGTIPNANPIVLDSQGTAAIWGAGDYRQVVTEPDGTVVWDADTLSPPTLATQAQAVAGADNETFMTPLRTAQAIAAQVSAAVYLRIDGTNAMTGQFRAIPGTVGAPGIVFDGHLATGFYRPAADTVAVATAGAERMRFAAAGNIGLQTTGPLTTTQVASTTDVATGPTAGLPNGVALAASGTNTVFGLAMGAATSGNSFLQAMRFDGLTTTYNMLLNPVGGSVGVGTLTPNKLSLQAAFTVNGATAASFSGFEIATADAVRGGFFANNADVRIQAQGSLPLYFVQNSAVQFWIGSSLITANQPVTIGTSAARLSPSGGYLVTSYGSGNSYWLLNANTNFNSAVYFGDPASDTSGGIVYVHNGDYLFGQTNGSERWRTTSAGNFLIGGATDNARLGVLCPVAGNGIVVSDGVNGTNVLRFSGSTGVEFGNVGASSLVLLTNNSERARLGASYGFSVGPAATPATILDVNGSVSMRQAGLVLANGLNSNIATPDYEMLRITGPTAAFSVGGLTGGTNGRIVTLHNTVAYAMTIVNEDAGSTAGNRITTLTGANVTLRAGTSAAMLQYDATGARWILINYN